MTRRAFLALPFVHNVVNRPPTVNMEGFSVSGHFDRAGEDKALAYFSLGQSVGLMLDPSKTPAMVAGADALVGQTVRLTLTRA